MRSGRRASRYQQFPGIAVRKGPAGKRPGGEFAGLMMAAGHPGSRRCGEDRYYQRIRAPLHGRIRSRVVAQVRPTGLGAEFFAAVVDRPHQDKPYERWVIIFDKVTRPKGISQHVSKYCVRRRFRPGAPGRRRASGLDRLHSSRWVHLGTRTPRPRRCERRVAPN
jgi:hypothetical protein